MQRLDDETPPQVAPATPAQAHLAALMLLIATLAWGCGFTWAKATQETINHRLGLPGHVAAGPLVMLSVRFVLAGIMLMLVVPRARTGWNRRSAARAVVLGGMLGAGMCVQHLGLGRTSEAVTAFLTSLTILFVPIMMTLALRRPPPPVFWVAVAVATLGIWLMTGATPAGFGLGEQLGLSCAVVFSVHLIAINVLVPRDDPWRMTAGQFLVSGILLLAACLLVDGGPQALRPGTLRGLLWADRQILRYMLLLLVFPTFVSFILMNLFQPRLDPSRAALIYLMEPVFAAAYAWMARGRGYGGLEICGAALILTANLMVEVINTRRRGTAKK